MTGMYSLVDDLNYQSSGKKLLKVISDERTAQILALLMEKELTVNDIYQMTELSKTTIYRVINILMSCGCVQSIGKPIFSNSKNGVVIHALFRSNLESLAILFDPKKGLEFRMELKKN